MRRARAIETIVCVLVACASAALAIRSIVVIRRNYFIPFFWDQWDHVREIMGGVGPGNLFGLFNRQNEHIIATSKVLFLTDYALFDFTNGPLVFAIAVMAIIVALLLAVLLFGGLRATAIFGAVWLLFIASGLSLAQWENLLWGFEPEFSLVLIAAIASILLTFEVIDAERSLKTCGWLAALVLAMGFCVFSMGNGVLIFIPTLFLLVIFRASPLKIAVVLVAGLAYAAVFFTLTRDAEPIGDPSLKTVHNLVLYFFAIIGNPLSHNLGRAVGLGLTLFLALCAMFARQVMVPLRRRRGVDRGVAGLFALVGFLLATGAAAAWSRTSLGVEQAFASRYATPMLVLWMASFALGVRIFQSLPAPPWIRTIGVSATLLAALGVVAKSSLTPGAFAELRARSTSVQQAGYVVAAGVDSIGQMMSLYYDPNFEQKAIEFLRGRRLNLFAGGLRLPAPSVQEMEETASPASLPACATGSIDGVVRVANNGWLIDGWAADAAGGEPRWVVAVDGTGRALGFTPPLVARPDVQRVLHSRRFFAWFKTPLTTQYVASGPFSLVALFGAGGQACRLAMPEALPLGPYETFRLEDAEPLAANVTRSVEAGDAQAPPNAAPPPPYPDATIVSVGADGSSRGGVTTIDLPHESCGAAVLPVARGPSVAGLRLTVRYPDDSGESIDLDSVAAGRWAYLDLDLKRRCSSGSPRPTTIILDGKDAKPGAWAALAGPARPR
jgi:hypothetical protein